MNAPEYDSPLAQPLAGFCLRQLADAPQQQRDSFPGSDLWRAVSATGTSL